MCQCNFILDKIIHKIINCKIKSIIYDFFLNLTSSIKDNDRKIREITQQTNEKFCLKVNKNLAPHLKTIIPYWVYAQCDPYSSASSKAQAAFKSVFSEAKQPEVINFAKNEILNVI